MKNEILNKKTNGWLTVDNDFKKKIFNFCDDYIDFLNTCKTEREASK